MNKSNFKFIECCDCGSSMEVSRDALGGTCYKCVSKRVNNVRPKKIQGTNK